MLASQSCTSSRSLILGLKPIGAKARSLNKNPGMLVDSVCHQHRGFATESPDADFPKNQKCIPRRSRALQASYMRPLKRPAQFNTPVCDLQIRSYSVRNLEFFADFALRSAYYLGLSAAGPIPLPRLIERWTVPKSNFIFKKSQENFERITLRRLVQIKSGHKHTLEIWLAYLRKHQMHGVGMKSNLYAFEALPK